MAKTDTISEGNRKAGRGRNGGLVTYKYGDMVMVVSFDKNGKVHKRMERRVNSSAR